MLSVRDIEIVRLQFKILYSRGFSIAKHVNKRLTVTSNDKFEIWLNALYLHRHVSRLAINIFLFEITILKGERKYTLVGPIIIYLFILFYLPHNNRKWITSNRGRVEKRSGEETGYRSLWEVI